MIAFGTIVRDPERGFEEVRLQPVTDETAIYLADTFATMSPWHDYSIQAETLRTYFVSEEPGAPRYIVQAGSHANQPIGLLGLRSNWLRGPYIQFLGLIPPLHNKGIGSALLTCIETNARLSGAQNIWVMASKINTRGQAFYKRHGFVEVTHIHDLVAPSQSEVLLRKMLT